VKPSITDVALSPDTNVTTESAAPPSMTVTDDPPVLRTAIALPPKSTFST